MPDNKSTISSLKRDRLPTTYLKDFPSTTESLGRSLDRSMTMYMGAVTAGENPIVRKNQFKIDVFDSLTHVFGKTSKPKEEAHLRGRVYKSESEYTGPYILDSNYTSASITDKSFTKLVDNFIKSNGKKFSLEIDGKNIEVDLSEKGKLSKSEYQTLGMQILKHYKGVDIPEEHRRKEKSGDDQYYSPQYFKELYVYITDPQFIPITREELSNSLFAIHELKAELKTDKEVKDTVVTTTLKKLGIDGNNPHHTRVKEELGLFVDEAIKLNNEVDDLALEINKRDVSKKKLAGFKLNITSIALVTFGAMLAVGGAVALATGIAAPLGIGLLAAAVVVGAGMVVGGVAVNEHTESKFSSSHHTAHIDYGDSKKGVDLAYNKMVDGFGSPDALKDRFSKESDKKVTGRINEKRTHAETIKSERKSSSENIGR